MPSLYDDTIAWHRYDGNDFEIIYAKQTPVPEPATMLLFDIGLLRLAGVSRRKK